VGNHAGFSQAPCVGNIGFIPDSDGKLRRLIQTTEWAGNTYPSLSLATLKCLGLPLPAAPAAIQTLQFDIDPQAWTVIPAHLTLDKPTQTSDQAAQLKSLIQNRIVIIGSSALGLSDRVATPLSSSISGMFVHAQSLTELLRPAGKNTGAFSTGWTAFAQILLVILFGLAVIRSQKLTWLVTATLVIGLAWIWFLNHQISQGNQAPLTAALWGFLGIGLFLIPFEWSQARAQSRATAKILARYVAKPVLKDLLKQQNFDPLKPRSAQITVLVADMVSYSQTVAEQPLDGAATITKEFLKAITDPVWSLRGTLDRYTGDGLIAFWGAPIPTQNHAELAVKAATQMHARVMQLNKENSARGLPNVQVRIGIASGSALVGDFGTDLRANYTAVGTCINMASRLEAAAKTLGVSTLISEVTASAVTQTSLTPLGEHEIRGLGRLTLFTLSEPPEST
jgi:adenylate cyclase